jgi:hypothetical protein
MFNAERSRKSLFYAERVVHLVTSVVGWIIFASYSIFLLLLKMKS